ncbi:hypothetical protein RRG08_063621 [Elysia crispata]|uniref:Uncharacterized protein n=1 Tax=Elysia crispata TaxID=231223 RepID=A0AAE1DYW3_9GAST|nr:hypothetical protein RRG08_063621 [Elysia crispata]
MWYRVKSACTGHSPINVVPRKERMCLSQREGNCLVFCTSGNVRDLLGVLHVRERQGSAWCSARPGTSGICLVFCTSGNVRDLLGVLHVRNVRELLGVLHVRERQGSAWCSARQERQGTAWCSARQESHYLWCLPRYFDIAIDIAIDNSCIYILQSLQCDIVEHKNLPVSYCGSAVNGHWSSPLFLPTCSIVVGDGLTTGLKWRTDHQAVLWSPLSTTLPESLW